PLAHVHTAHHPHGHGHVHPPHIHGHHVVCAPPRSCAPQHRWLDSFLDATNPSGSKAQDSIRKCLSHLRSGTDLSIHQVSKLEHLLWLQSDRVRYLKLRGPGVARHLHDLLNEISGHHVPSDVRHGIAEELCRAVAHEDSGSSESVSVSRSSSRSSSPVSSS